ncbi:MAG: NAD(P)H-dependent glycerol-3-phosphate dehydrogenase [Proteobacteria bacterium]|nr:NAD(P)H-dependent glycerol-3-phosphate dehydrogenase [Pseudomonadota bacterium]
MTVKEFENITMLGSGRWGTAVAIYLSRMGYKLTLQSHSVQTHEHLTTNDCAPNLLAFNCDKKIDFLLDINEAVEKAQIVITSTPVPFLRSVLSSIRTLDKKCIFVGINKGIEGETLLTVPEIIREYFPDNPIAHLGGPCFPEGLLSPSTPAAETLACEDDQLGQKLQELFSSSGFRVYRSTELKGVALLGALKNIYAIVAGIADGLGLYEEVISVLVTRSLAEMKRFCEHYNIDQGTLFGLSGLGDLALTCYSIKSSHNKNFGRRLGKGEKIESILETMEGTIAEGYFTTRAVEDLSRKLRLDLPICNMAYRIIYEKKPIQEGISELMSRPLKIED